MSSACDESMTLACQSPERYRPSYRAKELDMGRTAKLFRSRGQAARLPREFRFEGDRVRVRRAGRGELVEPMFTDVDEWYAE